MPQPLAQELLARRAELWNMYGPTETTVWSTCCQITDASKPITIGSPINNTRCYILDSQGSPVAVGSIGELYISGKGVAKGYLGRNDLTQERFLSDPFADGERMYRTGDLATLNQNRELIHKGRADDQVKVRGFRIELGEIETQLARHPSIERTVVIVREDQSNDKRIVAYYTSTISNESPKAELNLQTVRTFLASSLPDYMLPNAVVQLNTIPLTPNGKVDKKSLPKPHGQSDGDELPCSDSEKYLAALWKEFLKDEDAIYIDDNFLRHRWQFVDGCANGGKGIRRKRYRYSCSESHYRSTRHHC